MTKTISAIYENGVLRPVEPLTLPEGELVDVMLITREQAEDHAALVTALKEIAALPPEGPDDGFSGADHDKVLYGSRDGDAR